MVKISRTPALAQSPRLGFSKALTGFIKALIIRFLKGLIRALSGFIQGLLGRRRVLFMRRKGFVQDFQSLMYKSSPRTFT